MTSRLVFVYGSLRSGEHNNPYFMPDSKLLGTAITERLFKLSGAGTVPFAWPDDKEGVQLEGELWECPIQDYHSVRSLELGAGYEELKVGVWYEASIGRVPFVEAYMYTHKGYPGSKTVEMDDDGLISWPRRK